MLFKAAVCFAVSLCAVMILMPHLIDYLKRISFNQSVSEYSLEEYKAKAKTPIMGGVLFIAVPVAVTLAADFRGALTPDILVVLLTFVGYGLIGFIDDYLIAVKKNNDGLSAGQKFGMQLFLAVVFWIAYRSRARLDIDIPFTNHMLHIGKLYALLILFMFTGASNAVNLTDGMDGLAAGCEVIALIPLLIFAAVQKQYTIVIFIVSLIGALFGYLYFNVKPAKVFMGDTGALALGAVLAAISMILKKELALIAVGGIFVIETLCVIIQQVSVRAFHKRVFIYTPIHYAFIKKGMGERQVVRMFWLCEACLALIGLWIGLH
ncbi:MAG: phospho-N-acetylmuramoyl-pentapeptide-transferase [Solobacterium sp.]|nr:phospho-N-acetylmuramoyl-pentapeptide-transferase [Solobacterium sp.]